MGLLVMVFYTGYYQQESVIQRQSCITEHQDQNVQRKSLVILGRRRDTRGIKNHINGQDITLAIMIASVGTESSKIPARHRNFKL